MKEIILQEQVTLDQALISGMETFRNGCNFRLRIDAEGEPWLEYGCYGVHLNLSQGTERLLMLFVGVGNDYRPKKLDIHPTTLNILLKRKPCDVCGGIRFKVKP